MRFSIIVIFSLYTDQGTNTDNQFCRKLTNQSEQCQKLKMFETI